MDENELVPVIRDGAPVAGGAEDSGLVPVIRDGQPVVADRDEGPMAPRVAGWQPMDQEMSDAIASRGAVGQFLNTFGQGAAKGWGTDFVDKWMADQKLVRGTEPGDFDGIKSVFKAFNEVFPRTIAKTIEYPLRGLNAVIHGAGDAITEAGGGRSSFAGEMVQVAEMVLTAGKGGPTGGAGMPERAMQAARPKITPDVNLARDMGLIGPKAPDFATAPAEAISQHIRDNPMTAWHASPHSFEAFSMEHIGTGEGAQVYGRGLYFAENTKVMDEYGKSIPYQDFNRKVQQVYSEFDDAADAAAAVKEEKSFTPQQQELLAALEADDWLGFDYPHQAVRAAVKEPQNFDLSPRSQAAVDNLANKYEVRLHAAKDELLDWDKPLGGQLPKDMAERAAQDFYGKSAGDINDTALDFAIKKKLKDDPAFTQELSERGIPGIKYLDQGSRRADDIDIAETHNFVIFDESRIEIVSRNGQPIERPQMAMAKQAENAGDVVKSDVVAPPKTQWRERFDKFVDRLNTSDDVAALIRASATENGEFVAARNGPTPTRDVEWLSEGTGVPTRDLDLNTIGQRIPTDVEMAATMDMLVHVTERAQGLMRAANQTGGDVASLIELQAALMRRDLVVEHVVGLRAEWNRTGMVLQGKDAARPAVKSTAKTALGEFLDLVKDEATLKEWLNKNKGRSVDDLKELAKRGENLDRAQLAKLLQNARKPNFAENMHRYWVSAILSGIYGHGAFFFADAAYMALKYAVVTPVSGVVGAAKQLLAGDKVIERVYMGESFARGQGVIEAIPDAFMGMWETFKTGDVMLLPREITNGESMLKGVLNEINPGTGHRGGNHGAVDVVMTAGQRALAMQQSFFKILADRAEVHSLAYRETAKEGFSPASPDFWKRKHEHMVTPKEEWLDAGVKHAEVMTWINDMGGTGEAFDKWRRNSFGKWVVPFFRTPGNQANAARELIPGINLTSKATRNALLKGSDGAIAQDTQIANTVVGGMLLGYGAYLALGDRLTDGGPTDPQENAEWRLTHAPNSIRIGDQWVPLQKFGPLAVQLGMAAALTRVGRSLSEQEYGEAAAKLSYGVGNVALNATGMKGVSDMFRAQANPERYGEQYVANFAAGFLPLSTFMGQTASMLDPTQREVKTMLDALKNKTPYLRETLFPVRDWSGVPVANDRAGLKAFLAMRPVNFDPVDREMQALQITPTKAEPRIGNVRLTREQYDDLQNAGAVQTRQALQALVDMPSWYNLPEHSREFMFRGAIERARFNARTYVKMKYWGTEDDVLIKEMQDKVNHVTGQPRQFNKKANPLSLD